MSCKYVSIKSYAENPICTVTNNVCNYYRRCNTEVKWLPLDIIGDCPIALKKMRNVPKCANYVRFIKNGFAYVEVEDAVVKVPYTGDNTDFLYIKKVKGKYVINKSGGE